HVTQFADEVGSGRELKTAAAGSLHPEEWEQPMNVPLGNSGLFGDGAHAPMGGGLGLASERLGDQLGHRLILDRARPAATHLIVKPLDPTGDEAIAPFADRVRTDAKPRGHNSVAGLALASQYDLCSH